MAWTTPRTWANGLVVTATILNAEIRDNFDELDDHNHDDSAGHGSNELTGMATVQFDDDTAPAAPGTDKTVIYSVDGRLHQRSGAAGSDQTFSLDNHEHTMEEDSQSTTVPPQMETTQSVGTSYGTTQSAPAHVVGGSGKRLLVVTATAVVGVNGSSGNSATASIRIRKDSVQVKEVTSPTLVYDSIYERYLLTATYVEADVAAGSVTFDAQLKHADVSGSPSVLVDQASGASDGDRGIAITVTEISNDV